MNARNHRLGIHGLSVALALIQGAALAAEPGPICVSCEAAEAPTCGGYSFATIISYRACSAEASTRMLSEQEARECSSHYTTLKVNLAGLTMDEYRMLSSTQRAAVSLQGYAALRCWREKNQALWSAAGILSGWFQGAPGRIAHSLGGATAR